MSYNATVYNIMIASPFDVSAERGIIRDVVNEWNIINSTPRSIVLLATGWETHSSPEMGNTPQNIVNRQVLDKSDILVGVFWTRLGTPTTEYSSGTVEEIEKHIKSGKLTMLYFSSSPVVLDSVDQNQYNELKQFKESCKARSLYESYDDLIDFKDKFYRHLQLKLNTHEMFKIDHSIAPQEIQKSSVSIPVLSDVAKILLKEISIDPQGQVIYMRHVAGVSIKANGKEFCDSQEPREIAKWKGAIENLSGENLIKKTSKMDGLDIFSITDIGYKIADTVEQGFVWL